jgi:ATP-binding cassette, subfamily B, bacterial
VISRNGKLKIALALRVGGALRLVWHSGPGWTVASILLLIVQGMLPLVSLYLMKSVIDAVANSLTAPDKGGTYDRIVTLVLLAGSVALLGALCRSVAGLVSDAQAQTVTDHVQDILHAKSIEVDLNYYENSQYYDTLHVAQQEAPYRPARIVNDLARLSQSGISLLVMACLLFSLHWGIAAVLFISAIPGLGARLRFIRKLYRWRRERTTTERKALYFNWLMTKDAHAKELRLFGLGPLFMKLSSELRSQLRRERLHLSAKYCLVELIAQASATLAVFGSYAFIASRTLQGVITLGGMVMYYQAFQRGQEYLREMLGGLAGLYENSLFLSSLYEFLDIKSTVVEPASPLPVPSPIDKGIVFDHVSFRYPAAANNVLQDISLRIRPGEKIALVGENGSGKTTLIKLLCRLYDPTDGVITLDGIDLRRFELLKLRRKISAVFQDYARYHLTARENIWFGNVGLPPDQKRIVTAARQAGAHDVIESLPRDYDTVLGKWFEDGEELSVGEWQKIALSRALLRDGQIIVLDEPTSAMDVRAEDDLFKKFRRLSEGRMAVLISHRLSTVRMADCIYVLEGGKIVESGSHEELVRRGGSYARLFDLQAKYYV